MKKLNRVIIFVIAILLISSCNKGPVPIDYGNDGCHYCKMTIVDKIHGAELITDKGKVYKFDATECMLFYISENEALPTGNLFTNYYETPTAFIAIQDASFLISENLPSPMGAYLTAFENKTNAEKMKAEKGGQLHTWESLKTHLVQ